MSQPVPTLKQLCKLDPRDHPSLANIIDSELAAKTMPAGALGQVQLLARELTLNRGQWPDQSRPPAGAIVVFAADHGLAQAGVSAYPQEVTWQMVLNFLQGGAAISVLADTHNLALRIVDAGVNHQFADHHLLIKSKVAFGSNNCVNGSALDPTQVDQCLAAGATVVDNLLADHALDWIGFGEMGIGNTSIASLMLSALLGLDLDSLIGRGTGLDDAQLAHKRRVLKQVQQLHLHCWQTAPNPTQIAIHLGGLEIVMMAGAMLRCAQHRKTVVVDGFISTAACALALAWQPNLKPFLIASHCSAEAGHRHALAALALQPLLELDLRLGEGTGAAMAMPILASAFNLLSRMATFKGAKVSERKTQ
jgi:nicotinate-nucleotide--dimethylbenzimidazole phosphoribosyltransferase